MNARIITRTAAVCILQSLGLLASSKDLLHDAASSSVAEAKRNGAWVRTARVEPKSFLWENHSVLVTESWIEKLTFDHAGASTGEVLCFKLLIDGISSNESKIHSNERLQLIFRDADTEKRTIGFGGVSYAPKGGLVGRLGATLLRSGRNAEQVHEVALKQPYPAKIRLRIGTQNYKISGPKRTTMSGTIIMFRVDMHEEA